MTERAPLRVLLAPGPYKECLTAFDVAFAMADGIGDVSPQIQTTLRPMSDGGSGLARILAKEVGGALLERTVEGPLGQPVAACFALLPGGTAVIESATAIGLTLLPLPSRNPLRTSTFGVGQLIAAAAEAGARDIIVGCGDSSTNDCGVGCAAALGVRFLDDRLLPIERPTGADLRRIRAIDTSAVSPALSGMRMEIACNLTSVLLGNEGTCRRYAPQKGANAEDVRELELGVGSFVDLVYRDKGLDLAFVPGAGGSGGLAASLYAFFGAGIRYSIDVVDRFVRLDSYFSQTDLVLTGEGKIDDQTATGKIACGVGLRAKRFDLPVVAIVGSIAQDCEDIFYNGIDAVESIAEGPCSLEHSISNAPALIRRATARVMRFATKLLPRRRKR